MLNEIKSYTSKNTIISKILSHIDTPIFGNRVADELTKEAVEYAVFYKPPFTPWSSEEILKSLRKQMLFSKYRIFWI